ncbi:MAG: calcium/sodium antiporter [Acidimicrobiales bacterium]
MVLPVVFVLIGVVLLAKAADEFVVGAATMAIKLRISPVVIGAVIVGFGTSLPEMLVSGLAAGRGDRDLGVGNVIGSNVANLSLVLGVAALIMAIPVDRATMRREAPLSLLSVGLFALLVQDGFERWEGVVLAVALVTALFIILRAEVAGGDPIVEQLEELPLEEDKPVRVVLFRTFLGLAGTVLGAQLLVEGALDIAEEVGLGAGFVGLTLVAIGTSLPELVTAVIAARKGETGLIVGNLLGSNLFNSLAVGAVIGLIGPGPLIDSNLAGLATWIMVGVSVAGALFMFTGLKVVRWEAALLLVVYVATIPFLVSDDEDEEGSVGSQAVIAEVQPDAGAADPAGAGSSALSSPA